MSFENSFERLESISDNVAKGYVTTSDFNYLREIGNATLGAAATESYLGRSNSNESILSTFLKGGIILIILAIISKILGGGGGNGGGGGGGGGIVTITKTIQTSETSLREAEERLRKANELAEERANVRLQRTFERLVEDVKIERELAESDIALEKMAKERADINEEAKLYTEQFKFIDSAFKYDFKDKDGLKRKIAMAKALQKYMKTIKTIAATMDDSWMEPGDSAEVFVLRMIMGGDEVSRMMFLQRQRSANITQAPIANDQALADEYTKAVDEFNKIIEDMETVARRIEKIAEHTWNGLSDIIDRASTIEQLTEGFKNYVTSKHHSDFIASLFAGSDRFADYLAVDIETVDDGIDPRTAILKTSIVARRRGDSAIHSVVKDFNAKSERWFTGKVVLNPKLAVRLLDIGNGPLQKRIQNHGEITTSLSNLEKSLKSITDRKETSENNLGEYGVLAADVVREISDKFGPDIEDSAKRLCEKTITDVTVIGVMIEQVMRKVLIAYGKFNFAETNRLSSYSTSLDSLVKNLDIAEKSVGNLSIAFKRSLSTESHQRNLYEGIKWLTW